jgi:hypothetical protein
MNTLLLVEKNTMKRSWSRFAKTLTDSCCVAAATTFKAARGGATEQLSVVQRRSDDARTRLVELIIVLTIDVARSKSKLKSKT